VDEREALRAASEYIAKNGHHKGSLYSYEGRSDQEPAACALGAIRQVTAVCGYYTGDEYYSAVRRLTLHLMGAGHCGVGGEIIPKWNDAPETTAEEVILTLKRAAEE
jgi:hypothetical protein